MRALGKRGLQECSSKSKEYMACKTEVYISFAAIWCDSRIRDRARSRIRARGWKAPYDILVEYSVNS